MKIGKISGFGFLESEGKWYSLPSLYQTNRLYVVHSGSATFFDGEVMHEFSGGHIYFIPEMRGFCPIANKGEPFVHSYADFALISPMREKRILSYQIGECEKIKAALDVFTLACKIKDEVKLHDSESDGRFYTLFESSIAYLLTRIVEFVGADFITDDVVTRALAVMNRRMNEDLTVTDISASVYMSEDGFIRRFSRVMGVTPYAYLKKLRLMTAEGMMNDGESVVRAAEAVGYSDAASLIHALNVEKKRANTH